ncbi:MAG: alginate export family protein [Verrucomicrobiota bacterium JB023]|nr:alginate export family protein [Verrucomicrobiota bacterium JB023]
MAAGAQESLLDSWKGGLPDWLSVSGESRVRYETLDGQFRKDGAGGDQLLLFRSLFQVEADFEDWAVGVEIQDSRTYLGDTGTPLGSSITNSLDILQLYTRIGLPGLLGPSSHTELILGRQTVSIGSKRQIERVSFANVIKSYTGGHLISRNEQGDELHALLVVPINRLPNDFDGVLDNNLVADEEEWHRRIWGLHYRQADSMTWLAPDIWSELFVYGLHEEDSEGEPTVNRNYLTPGFRLYRKPTPGHWDIDIEGAIRTGSRRATAAAGDREDLDVFASMLFAAVGYTFELPWQPRLALEYYWASGDEDPEDDQYGQYERLFGSRRTDLNNTSIHGPLTPANLSAPGLRLEVKPSQRMDARIAYSAAFLASERDAWVIANLQDESGQSGRFLGHAFDGRLRYWLQEERLQGELGVSFFLRGDYARNVSGSPQTDSTFFAYSSLSFHF